MWETYIHYICLYVADSTPVAVVQPGSHTTHSEQPAVQKQAERQEYTRSGNKASFYKK